MDAKAAHDVVAPWITPDGGLQGDGEYLSWQPGDETACLDGHFTADQLEAIAAYMRASESGGQT